MLLEIDGNCLRNLGLTLMISSFLPFSEAVLKLLLIHRFSLAIKLRAKTRSKNCASAVKVARQKQSRCEEMGRNRIGGSDSDGCHLFFCNMNI